MARRIEKMREDGATELKAREKDLAEQIFRLKFQMSTGQAEALKRLREARKDLARVKTLLRAQELTGAATANTKSAKTGSRQVPRFALRKLVLRRRAKHLHASRSGLQLLWLTVLLCGVVMFYVVRIPGALVVPPCVMRGRSLRTGVRRHLCVLRSKRDQRRRRQ